MRRLRDALNARDVAGARRPTRCFALWRSSLIRNEDTTRSRANSSGHWISFGSLPDAELWHTPQPFHQHRSVVVVRLVEQPPWIDALAIDSGGEVSQRALRARAIAAVLRQ